MDLWDPVLYKSMCCSVENDHFPQKSPMISGPFSLCKQGPVSHCGHFARLSCGYCATWQGCSTGMSTSDIRAQSSTPVKWHSLPQTYLCLPQYTCTSTSDIRGRQTCSPSFLIQTQIRMICVLCIVTIFLWGHLALLLGKVYCTRWPRPRGCLIVMHHFPHTGPIISGSFAENDLQLEKENARNSLLGFIQNSYSQLIFPRCGLTLGAPYTRDASRMQSHGFHAKIIPSTDLSRDGD